MNQRSSIGKLEPFIMYAMGTEFGILSLCIQSLSLSMKVPTSLANFHKQVWLSLKISLHSEAIICELSCILAKSTSFCTSTGGTEYGDSYVDVGMMPISPLKVGTSSTKWQCVPVNCLMSSLMV